MPHLDGPEKQMPGSRTPDLDSLRPEPTTRSGDPTGFQVHISIQPVLPVARWVSSSLPRLESLHTEKLYLLPKDFYRFWFSLTWHFSLLLIWPFRTATLPTPLLDRQRSCNPPYPLAPAQTSFCIHHSS